ncbi:hypothetical protein BO78DRAFT_34130 [Aspergillus sclerotiicarbonarius CBS 121057]|uniref:Uncharacterized protein n=1 Tax=Aspergillus sclerotiicarbonarius (strain CBS 121057 / IBT 28362) TaxID=1448318 RepID=A0A319DSU3_ASPSB|nr:hypothetical protein BO78DRAFT_34130 [Aspergillus sclerotiicarbonarius CBS 121057]
MRLSELRRSPNHRAASAKASQFNSTGFSCSYPTSSTPPSPASAQHPPPTQGISDTFFLPPSMRITALAGAGRLTPARFLVPGFWFHLGSALNTWSEWSCTL